MDAHGGAALKAGEGVGGVDAQLVDGVPGLMDDGVDVAHEVVLVDVRRHARVAHAEALRERVLGEGQGGGGHVQAHQLHKVEGQVALDAFRHPRGEEIRLGLLAALGDIADQRDHGFADLREELVVGRRVHAALVLVEPDVVRVAGAVEVAGLALERLDHAVDVGLEGIPIVGELGLVPHGVRLAREAAPCFDLFLGECHGFALVALEDADLVGELGVVELALGDRLVELVDQLLRALAGEDLVVLAGKGRHRFATGGGGVLRSNRGAVELGDL